MCSVCPPKNRKQAKVADRNDCCVVLIVGIRSREDLLSDCAKVEKAEKLKQNLPDDVAPKDLAKCLEIIIRTCKCCSISPDIKEIREKMGKMESELEFKRNRMKLGSAMPGGSFQAMSSIGLRNLMSTNEDEGARKAAYEGLRAIGPFITDNGFVEIVKLVCACW